MSLSSSAGLDIIQTVLFSHNPPQQLSLHTLNPVRASPFSVSVLWAVSSGSLVVFCQVSCSECSVTGFLIGQSWMEVSSGSPSLSLGLTGITQSILTGPDLISGAGSWSARARSSRKSRVCNEAKWNQGDKYDNDDKYIYGSVAVSRLMFPPVFSFLSAVFICSFMVAAPIFGYLGDRFNRKVILSCGIFFWSTVTLSSSFIGKEVRHSAGDESLSVILLGCRACDMVLTDQLIIVLWWGYAWCWGRWNEMTRLLSQTPAWPL